MKWLDFLKEHKLKAEAQAKGKVELKPRHLRKLKEIWKDKYLDKKGHTLNNLFEVTYAEAIASYTPTTSILDLMPKRSYDFCGKSIELKLDKDSTSVIP